MHLADVAYGEFGICARNGARQVDSITDTEMFDTFADTLDNPCTVGPRRIGQLWQARITSSANVRVNRIYSNRI